MKDIPEWIIKITETDELYCNKCKDIFRKDNLISIGIQQSGMEPHDDKLCVGMFCSKCREITIFELKDMSLVEFAFEILERETDPKDSKKYNNKTTKQDMFKEIKGRKKRKLISNRSKITKKDLNEAVRFLRNVKTHEEFLVAMGMSPEQINQYRYKESKEE